MGAKIGTTCVHGMLFDFQPFSDRLHDLNPFLFFGNNCIVLLVIRFHDQWW
jgi:hypothetical protein